MVLRNGWGLEVREAIETQTARWKGERSGEVMAVSSKKRKFVVADAPTAAHYKELKRTLLERRREILRDVLVKIRGVRSGHSAKDYAVLDPGETSEVAIQKDIGFALIQMKGETLNRIDEALSRFEDGTYGHCCECGEDIARPRLSALPFASRCKNCEQAREMTQQRERIQAQRGSSGLGARLPINTRTMKMRDSHGEPTQTLSTTQIPRTIRSSVRVV